MNLQQVAALDKQYYMNTFGERLPVLITHGQGCTLYAEDGRSFTDFFSGIAVNALGYNDPGFTEALCEQAHKVLHLCNYFYNEPQAHLAQLLCENTCADRVFFASTGAEANEGAIKLARKYFYSQGIDRYEIISANNSFHGRTLATIAATGQEKYQKPFRPLPVGFLQVEYGNVQAVKEAINEHTAAVLVEPIQGEGGVICPGAEYLKGLRELCDAEGILLIFDEVQTGMGRTGKLFAHQLYGVEPDIFTSAKALGNGVPVSAVLCKEFCSAFVPGDHGTTFGGNPLCCAAGCYVVKTMTAPGFLEEVAQKGAYLKEQLAALQGGHAAILDVRGEGFLLGVQLDACTAAGDVSAKMRDKGFIVGTAGGNTLRIAPPLIISKEEIEAFVRALDEVLPC